MKKYITSIGTLTLLASFFYGDILFHSSKTVLVIWFEQLVPSLFFPMVCIKTLYKQHYFNSLPALCFPALFKIDKTAWNIVLCTVFLGFPNSSIFIDKITQQGVLSAEDGKRLLCCCCFPAPGFVIITCGIVLYNSIQIGIMLFVIQIASGLCLLFFTRHKPIICHALPHASSSFMNDLRSSLIETGVSLYMIGGYLLFFSNLTALFLIFFPSSPIYLQSLLEFSNGITYIYQSASSFEIKLIFSSFLLAFGGFCVHMQIMGMVEHIRLSYLTFLKYRILQGILSGFFFYLWLYFF